MYSSICGVNYRLTPLGYGIVETPTSLSHNVPAWVILSYGYVCPPLTSSHSPISKHLLTSVLHLFLLLGNTMVSPNIIRIALAQTSPQSADSGPPKLEKAHSTSPFPSIDQNLVDVAARVVAAAKAGADVVVFPEYFLQGIANENRQVRIISMTGLTHSTSHSHLSILQLSSKRLPRSTQSPSWGQLYMARFQNRPLTPHSQQSPHSIIYSPPRSAERSPKRNSLGQSGCRLTRPTGTTASGHC